MAPVLEKNYQLLPCACIGPCGSMPGKDRLFSQTLLTGQRLTFPEIKKPTTYLTDFSPVKFNPAEAITTDYFFFWTFQKCSADFTGGRENN